ncbi:MAG: PAS domain-containing protein [Rhizobacter sp.]|nr:PAS domain-containing protein [Ferruginibacter sp.]
MAVSNNEASPPRINIAERDIYNAFMQSPVAIAIFKGKDYRIEFANDFYLKILDKDRSIIGKSLFDVFPELNTQGTALFLNEVLKCGNGTHVNEQEFHLASGLKIEQRFFNCDYQPLRENNNTITGIIVIFTEVTEQVLIRNKEAISQRKLTTELGMANIEIAFQKEEKGKRAAELGIANLELAFQDSEKEIKAGELINANREIAFQSKEKERREAELRVAKYARIIIEASLDPLFTISLKGKITDINNAAVKITGSSREQLIGSDFFDYFTEPQKAREAYEQIFANGFVADYSLTIKDHKLTDVLFNGSIYKDDEGRVLGVVIVARDVTTQKNIEKNLEKSLKEVSDYKYALDESSIVSITDQKGIINYANDNFCKISKYECGELIGKDHRIINSGYHTKEFIRNLWMTISNGKIWKGELRNKAKDETLYWVDTTIVPFLDDRGKPYQYIVIRTDITEQKKIEKELTDAKVVAELATTIAKEAQSKAESATELAKNAVKAKQQFLSNMSHEIRTPMNAIIGFTKVVLKTDLTSKQKEYINAIKMSGDSLIVLINDILDLAKVDAGKMTFEKTAFKLATSISAMLHLFETKTQEKNLQLITYFDSTIPEVLIGDPVRLHQIILNLVSNAVKFTNAGKITVNVHLLSQDDSTVNIQFTVTDTGIGIHPNKIDEIFDNFQQATSGTSRLYGGTGLGLAIVKQLVEPQGGSITVQSKIGEGSTFRFILPFQKTNQKAKAETDIIELHTDNKNISVLVVEDIALNQLLMTTVLDDFGFQCDITANGKLAIDKMKANDYDIILMDLQMPEMNGFEATEYIRNTMKSDIPIIALTADVTTVDVAKCLAVGMNDYIAKPIDERLLYSKMLRLVKKPFEKKTFATGERKEVSCIDLSYLNQRTKSDPALMIKMISLYLQQTPPLVQAMKQGFRDKDWKLLYSSVHKMIPSFSIMGISATIELMAKEIQEYANSQHFINDIPDMVLKIEEACSQACKELEAELIRLKKMT